MITVSNPSTDPYFNMAFDEWCLKHYTDETIFYLWRNSPSVIIGCNQDINIELDIDYCKNQGIKIVRRCSGGGTVYHDLGNINFSFIGSASNTSFIIESRQRFIDALNIIGIKTLTTSSNDIFVDGKKISGTATHLTDKSILFHGTLLYDVDLTQISKVQNAKTGKIVRKSVLSKSSPVTNIKPLLKESLTTEAFMIKLQSIINPEPEKVLILSRKDRELIEYIANEKYRSKQWINQI